jgi:hypothetical protein
MCPGIQVPIPSDASSSTTAGRDCGHVGHVGSLQLSRLRLCNNNNNNNNQTQQTDSRHTKKQQQKADPNNNDDGLIIFTLSRCYCHILVGNPINEI